MSLTNIEPTIILDLYDHDATPSTIKTIQLDSNTRYVAAVIRDKGESTDSRTRRGDGIVTDLKHQLTKHMRNTANG